ncbi:54S ribosomal protein L12 [Drepanopeziza brunnea f. sp. 'multigermtubi' MB_m1]|uniref:54S ribosomal protein L12 n=1 Tax=Marssonina brunnea f. sp. multigermtubi (strain MB_m1) TaxID=1072389 RepID=K1XDB3_MARBU|nr:54S ribosomal protein L12 [Drepanopeziza brunnea f. sp. 'multigermtubi' MB_m1]EKD18843.1 54S ribosomal protein L12 [Drepanopeziza brunnea f. sp. 'multigermtubi' MB_m1]
MSLSCHSAARSCVRSLRSQPCLRIPAAAAVAQRRSTPARRWQTTEAAATNPKISGIVDQISQLTLLETADLVASLKSRLNIPDMPMGGFAAGPAAPAAAAPVEEEEAAPVQQEKTLFNLKLVSFEAGSKPKIIKEVKSMLGLSLVDSKKFVESAPKLMKEGVPKEEAEKIVATLKELGAVVTMD